MASSLTSVAMAASITLAFLPALLFSSPPPYQASTLLSLKSLINDPFHNLHNWLPSTDPCLWSGIACNASGFVASLDLSSMNLSGAISPRIGELIHLANLTLAVNNFSQALPMEISSIPGLTFLNISNNMFTSAFPGNFSRLQLLQVLDAYNNNFSGPLPLEISRLHHLQHLHLGGNYFDGTIPPQYSNMESLTYLGLSGNSLSGRIPPELGNLVKLKELYLGYYNVFDGGIPPELGRLTDLQKLDMASCGLNGSLPSELGSLSTLDSLFLQTNEFTGPIPAQFGNMSGLQSLDLSNNHLTGIIPEDFKNLQQLQLLNLFLNQLSGEIPSFIGDLPNLQVLQLWENNMTGTVPEQLGRNGQLVLLDLSSNSFGGVIPQDLCFGARLQRLILLGNAFTGPIPDGLRSCKDLERIRLGKNELNGSIPPALFELPLLQILELESNQLTGTLPSDIPQNTQLGLLDLSANHLSGVIPPSIGNLTALQTFLMPGNQISGSIPVEVSQLKHLSKVDWSNNHLNGSIPPEVSQCEDLTVLDLSNNQLTGEIPYQLKDLTVLDALNLSQNQLSGHIPSSLQAMHSLTEADFSYNNLSGPIPGGGQFANFNTSSFLGNPGLCGAQLEPCAVRIPPTQQPANRLLKRGPGFLSWVILAAISSLTIIILVSGILCNKHAFCALLGRDGSEREWKLTAFQRVDFTASDVLECLAEENIIGKGGAGTVYRGIMSGGRAVAVKRLPGSCRGSYDHGFSAEIQTLGKIRHRHIVRLLGCCSNHEINLLVYEYMPNGSLGELLHGPRGGLLDWPNRYRIATEAAKGLCYLHHDCSPLIVHRDVKSNNILLDSNFEAHVADFGLAKVLQEAGKCESMSSIAGSYGYIAPEYAYTLKVDEKSDIYSFGVVLLELLTGRRPIEPEYGDGVEIASWVKERAQTRGGALEALDGRMVGAEMEAPPQVLHEMMLVLRVALLCLADLPMQRPTMREVVQMLADVPRCRDPPHDAAAAACGSMVALDPPDLITI